MKLKIEFEGDESEYRAYETSGMVEALRCHQVQQAMIQAQMQGWPLQPPVQVQQVGYPPYQEVQPQLQPQRSPVPASLPPASQPVVNIQPHPISRRMPEPFVPQPTLQPQVESRQIVPFVPTPTEITPVASQMQNPGDRWGEFVEWTNNSKGFALFCYGLFAASLVGLFFVSPLGEKLRANTSASEPTVETVASPSPTPVIQASPKPKAEAKPKPKPATQGSVAPVPCLPVTTKLSGC